VNINLQKLRICNNVCFELRHIRSKGNFGHLRSLTLYNHDCNSDLKNCSFLQDSWFCISLSYLTNTQYQFSLIQFSLWSSLDSYLGCHLGCHLVAPRVLNMWVLTFIFRKDLTSTWYDAVRTWSNNRLSIWLVILVFLLQCKHGWQHAIFLTGFWARANFFGWIPWPMAGYHSSFFGDTHPWFSANILFLGMLRLVKERFGRKEDVWSSPWYACVSCDMRILNKFFWYAQRCLNAALRDLSVRQKNLI
jgi:hypothetical protein